MPCSMPRSATGTILNDIAQKQKNYNFVFNSISLNNVVTLYYIFTSKPTEKEVGLQPKIDEHRLPIFR